EQAGSLVARLAEVLPSYRLPSGTVAHTRHYMPTLSTTTKVIDAFVHLEPGQDLLIHYPVELTAGQTEMLERLVAHLGYLSSAESWVDGRLVEDVEPDERWCRPVVTGAVDLPDRGGEQVAVLAPVPAAEYAAWREAALARAAVEFEEQRGKQPNAKDRQRLEAPYPQDLMACLLVETADLQRHGWSQPPGSRRVLYTRPAGTAETRPPLSV